MPSITVADNDIKLIVQLMIIPINFLVNAIATSCSTIGFIFMQASFILNNNSFYNEQRYINLQGILYSIFVTSFCMPVNCLHRSVIIAS